MPEMPNPAVPRRQSRLWATLKALVRARITAGLLVVLPVWLTFLLVRFVFEIMRDASQWVVHGILRGALIELLPTAWTMGSHRWTDAELAQPEVSWGIAISSVFLTIFVLYLIGLLTTNLFGRRAIEALEGLLDHVPLVKTIYRASKQILTTFAGPGEGGRGYQRVALVPFPSADVRSVGFITNTTHDALTGEDMCTVFVAATPPTTGFVFVMKRSDVIEVDWTVEDAVKLVMSFGALLPANMAAAAGLMLRARSERSGPARAGS